MPTLGRSGSFSLVALLVACGRGAESPSPDPATAEPVASSPAPEPESGDELLRRAREGIRDGALPAAEEEAVLGSSDPAHARARRLLLAMREAPAEDAPAEGDDGDAPTPLVPPASDATPAPVERESHGGSRSTPASPRHAPPRAGSSRVGKLSLRATERGATLTIKGSAKLVVGVANQPSSGIVRVIVEKAEAASSVLTARPRVEGARVTGVRQGRDTLQVTVSLDPGWTLGSVSPFAGGAKVNLVAPR